MIADGRTSASGDIYIVNDPISAARVVDVHFPCRCTGRQDFLLAVEHRPLARHRRFGAGRLLGLRNAVGQEGLRLPPVKLFRRACSTRNLRHLLQHPCCRSTHRRYPSTSRPALLIGEDRLNGISIVTAMKFCRGDRGTAPPRPPRRCAPTCQPSGRNLPQKPSSFRRGGAAADHRARRREAGATRPSISGSSKPAPGR